jgi:hypothetical protein
METMLDLSELEGIETNTYGDRIIPCRHFRHCPFQDMKSEGFATGKWGLSKGGHPVPNGQWAICILHRDREGLILPLLTQDKWIMPECFSAMFDHFEKQGDSERVRSIRRALGLN